MLFRSGPNTNQHFNYSDYSDIIDDILIRLIHDGKGIEINSGGYRSKANDSNPSITIIKRYKELGGEIITTGSDAHIPTDIHTPPTSPKPDAGQRRRLLADVTDLAFGVFSPTAFGCPMTLREQQFEKMRWCFTGLRGSLC